MQSLYQEIQDTTELGPATPPRTILVIAVGIGANIGIREWIEASNTVSFLLGAVSLFMPNGYLVRVSEQRWAKVAPGFGQIFSCLSLLPQPT